jgi:hypothetical protein
VVDADVISAFWDGTTCHTVVHKLGREQPNTHLWRGGGWAAFFLGNANVATRGGRVAPTKTIKGTRKGTKSGKKW